MGAKAWMLVSADGDAAEALAREPALDVEGTLELARNLFPKEKLQAAGETNLWDTAPSRRSIHLGRYADVAVVAAWAFGRDHPSRLPPHFLKALPSRNVYLVAMHSTVDWFAFAHWSGGMLVRSLSLAPDNGIMEDLGDRLPFEGPFWQGLHPVPSEGETPYPLAFHPLDLAEVAMLSVFGYGMEGPVDANRVRPEAIRLLKLKRPWWRLLA